MRRKAALAFGLLLSSIVLAAAQEPVRQYPIEQYNPPVQQVVPPAAPVPPATAPLIAAPSATAPTTTAPTAAVPSAAAPSTTMPSPPEALGAIGRLFNQSISNIGAGVKGAGDTIGAGVKGAGETFGATTSAAGDLARGMSDAAGTVARLPLTNVVAGWERCGIAANGAPDCVAASVVMCRAKGFSTGSSIDITSARKCPAQVWMQGREPVAGECKDESFVARAACQ